MNCGLTGDTELLYVNFNQDYSCLSVGTRRGFRIYNCDPFGKCYGRSIAMHRLDRFHVDEGGAGICEMLFSSSLVAVAGAGEPKTFSPRKLQVINTKTVICELGFVSKILAIRMNRKRLVVVLEERIHIYDISNMKILHTVDTSSNPNGIYALSPNPDRPYLAYPARNASGEISVMDLENFHAVCVLHAHKSSVAAVAFNSEGSLLATASDKLEGTIIRVFSIPDATKIHQFRRGTYPATIYSLSFNLQSNLLAVTSDSDTIHIFKLHPPIATLLGTVLPAKMGQAWESPRDFAHIRQSPSSRVPSLCAINNATGQVWVASADGYFYVYLLDIENGGSCMLLRKHSFRGLEESSQSSSL